MSKLRLLPLLACLLLTVGCRKDLCYDHDQHSLGVRFDLVAAWDTVWQRDYGCDWANRWNPEWSCSYQDLIPSPATGIRAMVYHHETGKIYDERNFPTTGGRLYLTDETFSILFYNNDTEYIVFDGLHSVAHTRATTRTLTRSTYMAMHKEERTINPPDMLYGHYIERYEGERAVDAYRYEGTLKPLVYTYLIRYEFSAGLEYVSLARGALAGMAESVYLHDGHTGSESATMLYDCTVEPWGVEARVRTFGAPNYPGDHYLRGSEEPAHYALNLEVKLTNGTLKTFEFDISDQLFNQPRGGVITVSGLEITDEDAAEPEGGGGFDVDVESWGDIIDIPLEL